MTGQSSASVLSLLEQAHRGLAEAAATKDTRMRYAIAHLAALRGTASILAARTHPHPTRGRRRPRSAWVLLAELAPELSEWALYFASGAARRAAAEAGLAFVITAAEADDLVRDVDTFLTLVDRQLAPA